MDQEKQPAQGIRGLWRRVVRHPNMPPFAFLALSLSALHTGHLFTFMILLLVAYHWWLIAGEN